MPKPLFSIALIARNEENSIWRLFASLQEYLNRGGEVVIVDTGSQDGTVELARKKGARVVEAGTQFHSSLTDEQVQQIQSAFARGGEVLPLESGQQWFDFAAARTMATTEAAGDFVLMPDASDEFLDLDLAWLNDQIGQGRACGFRYRLKLGESSFSQTRFFDRRLYEWRGKTHEALYDREDPAAQALRTTAPPLLRCSEEQLSLRHHRGVKARPYMAGMALDLLADRGHGRWQHYLGRECFYFELWHSAIALLKLHAANDSAWSAERNESLCLAGRCFEALGDEAAAKEHYQQAPEIDNSRREPWLRLARLHNKQGAFAEAAKCARAALQIATRGAFSESNENYTHLPHALLYWSLFWLGEREEAEHHWLECCKMDPENLRFLAHAKLFADSSSAPK